MPKKLEKLTDLKNKQGENAQNLASQTNSQKENNDKSGAALNSKNENIDKNEAALNSKNENNDKFTATKNQSQAKAEKKVLKDESTTKHDTQNLVNLISDLARDSRPKDDAKSDYKVLIRADSSSKIGHGHIVRDLVLAKAYDNVTFACRQLHGSLVDSIPYEVIMLESMDVEELIEVVNEGEFKLVVLDHYGISYADEERLKRRTRAKILCVDDEIKAHCCDILLNPNPFAKAAAYEGLVGEFCELRCGFSHALIRDEFYAEAGITRDKIYDIFICFGGTDTKNLSAKTALNFDANTEIFIATTSANPNLDRLRQIADKFRNITLGVDTPNLARKMNESKKLIITASSLVNEALLLKADFKAICTAQNQLKIAQWLRANGKEVEFYGV